MNGDRGSRPGRRRLTIALFLLALVAAAFGGVAGHEFLNIDDNAYVTANTRVRAGLSIDGARWALTSIEQANWHPLTWLAHMIDVELFGLRAGAHHLVNVAWHAGAALLLFAALGSATGSTWRAAFVAGVFALHPLRVESVAWVAERKDVLAGFFWFAAIFAHVRRARRPRRGSFLPVLLPAACALASKPMAVTLPLTLLVLDFWPLGRLRGRAELRREALVEKIPLFLLAAATTAVTLTAQFRGGAVGSLREFTLSDRFTNAALSALAYVGKTLWPTKLSVFYPFRTPATGGAVAAAILLFAVTFLLYRLRNRRPALIAGWAWYLVTLLPVIGIVQVGEQALADRYTYIPLVGLAMAATWVVPALCSRPSRRPFLAAGAALLFCLLAGLTRHQTSFWKDSETLMRHALAIDDRNPVAHNNLGAALLRAGRLTEARESFEAALRVRPEHASAHLNIGAVLLREGRFAEAEASTRRGVALAPRNTDARYLLGLLALRQGRPREAALHFEAALEFHPGHRAAAGELAGLRAAGFAAPAPSADP